MSVQSTTFYRGQSFTAGTNGALTAVELLLNSCDAGNSADVLVAIHAGPDPTATPALATAMIPSSLVPYVSGCSAGSGPDADWVLATFSAPVWIDAGRDYSIWTTTIGDVNEYGWWGDSPGAYAGGEGYTHAGGSLAPTGSDLGFRTHVAAEAVDQAFEPANPIFGLTIQTATVYRGQSFTAGISGELTAVELLLSSCNAANDSPVALAIHSGATPASRPIATAEIPASSIPYVNGCFGGEGVNAVFVRAELVEPVTLEAGQVYSIWATSRDGVDEYAWWGVVFNGYPGGQAMTRTNGTITTLNNDVAFRTLVVVLPPAPIPVLPGGAALLALALGLTALSGSRYRTVVRAD